MPKKFWSVIVALWKDSVISKVISAGIIVGIGALYLKYEKHTLQDIYNPILNVLTFTIPIYFTLIAIAVIILIIVVVNKLKAKPDPLWSEQLGDYTFKEMYENMLLKRLPPTIGDMRDPNGETQNLVRLFHTNTFYLGHGISLKYPVDDFNYSYSTICPMLMQYGVLTKTTVPNEEYPDWKETVFTMSPIGIKFIANLEKMLMKYPKERVRAAK